MPFPATFDQNKNAIDEFMLKEYESIASAHFDSQSALDDVLAEIKSLQSELTKLLKTRPTGIDEERLERWYRRSHSQLQSWGFSQEAYRFETAPYPHSFSDKAGNLFRQAEARGEVLQALTEDISAHRKFYEPRIVLTERLSDGQKSEELDDSLPIFSRRQFDADLTEMRCRASESAPLSLMLVDVDHFKNINDTLQHSGGDEVLLGIASALRVVCEGKGRCYRWGGDEMAALLSNYRSNETLALAERLREQVLQLKFDGYAEHITLSVGIACFPGPCHTPETLFKEADTALYAAKESGRNRVCLAGASAGATIQKGTVRLSQVEITQRLDNIRLWIKLVNYEAHNVSLSVH